MLSIVQTLLQAALALVIAVSNNTGVDANTRQTALQVAQQAITHANQVLGFQSSTEEGSATNITTSTTFAFTSPAGGEIWQVGKTVNIVWSAPDLSPDTTVDIFIQKGDLAADVVGNTTNSGSFSWVVPATQACTSYVDTVNPVYRIGLMFNHEGWSYEWSKPFSIQGVTTSVSMPVYCAPSPSSVAYPKDDAKTAGFLVGSSLLVGVNKPVSGEMYHVVLVNQQDQWTLGDMTVNSGADPFTAYFHLPASLPNGGDYRIIFTPACVGQGGVRPECKQLFSPYFSVRNPQIPIVVSGKMITEQMADLIYDIYTITATNQSQTAASAWSITADCSGNGVTATLGDSGDVCKGGIYTPLGAAVQATLKIGHIDIDPVTVILHVKALQNNGQPIGTTDYKISFAG